MLILIGLVVLIVFITKRQIQKKKVKSVDADKEEEVSVDQVLENAELKSINYDPTTGLIN